MRVAHVITTLKTGGAEAMLAKVTTALSSEGCEALVICLGEDGPVGRRIRESGIETVVLDLSNAIGVISRILSVIRKVRAWGPNVIHGWMYHGNVVAWLLARVTSRSALMWNIRCNVASIYDYQQRTRVVIRWNSRLSSSAAKIVFNSRDAIDEHRAIGFDVSRAVLIPNGFDTGKFQPSSEYRTQTRSKLAIAPNEKVLGMVARFDPVKDFETFFAAAALLKAKGACDRFILAGPGLNDANVKVVELANKAGVREQMLLLGEVEAVERLLPAFDVFCLTSAWGEGFPNVIGEAMACGIPCVGTRVGGIPEIIGTAEQIVQPKDAVAIAQAIAKLLSMPVSQLRTIGQQARDRIVQNYSLPSIRDRYLALYREYG